ncbi:MAG: ABC transporter permease, partial [Terriglobia bacterium]
VLTLAVGIGANTAIFTLVDPVMLKSLPVQNPQQLVLLDWTSQRHSDDVMSNIIGDVFRDKSGRWVSTSFSYPVYEQIRARNNVLSGVTALAGNGSHLNVGYNGQPGRADGELVSGTFFSTFGVRPILGRALTLDDDRTGASPAAVISYGYWERRFGGDHGIVGRAITVNGVPFTIVGVSPPGFYGVQPGRAVEIWLPLHSEPQVEPLWGPLLETRGSWWALIMGRLKPGVSEQEASADLEVILQQSIAPDVKPGANPETIPHLGVESASKGLSDLRSEFSKPLYILMVIVGLVLLIACSNVANLLLARAASRQKEIAVRLALGGGRARLARQLLTESVLLAALGGAVGLLLAFWVTNLLVTFMASGREPLSLNVAPDLRVLGFTAAATMLTGLLFGLSPALRSTRINLTPALKESPGELLAGTGRRRSWRLDKVLVVTQVSLSILLLIGAVQFVRTLANLENVNLGFNESHLLLFGIDPTQDGYKGQRVADFYQELARRLGALPGVRSVGLSENTLIGGGASFLTTKVRGSSRGEKSDEVEAFYNWVGPKFFETMGIPTVLGRTLRKSDTEARPRVAVVNEQFVRQFLGHGDPIGRRFSVGSRSNIEIAGVAGDAKFYGLRQGTPPTVYLPFLQ